MNEHNNVNTDILIRTHTADEAVSAWPYLDLTPACVVGYWSYRPGGEGNEDKRRHVLCRCKDDYLWVWVSATEGPAPVDSNNGRYFYYCAEGLPPTGVRVPWPDGAPWSFVPNAVRDDVARAAYEWLRARGAPSPAESQVPIPTPADMRNKWNQADVKAATIRNLTRACVTAINNATRADMVRGVRVPANNASFPPKQRRRGRGGRDYAPWCGVGRILHQHQRSHHHPNPRHRHPNLRIPLMTDILASVIPWSYGIVVGAWSLVLNVASILPALALVVSWICAIFYPVLAALDAALDADTFHPPTSRRAPAIIALVFLPFYLNVCALQSAFILVGADIVYHTLTHTNHTD
jgi:hypothetical protein